MKSILQVKFFRGELLQLFRTYQLVQIPKMTSQYWRKPYRNMTKSVFLKIRECQVKLDKTKCQIKNSRLYFLDAIFCQKVLKLSLTDNGSGLSSNCFKSFLRTQDFEHRTISPPFHQLNGLVESAREMLVKFLKQQGFLDLHTTIWSQTLEPQTMQ